MQVVGLWRYPVKSLQGERLEVVEVTPDGLAGDRRFAIFDTRHGPGTDRATHARAAVRMPRGCARTARPRSRLPDGSVADDDAALSRWLGRPVHLRSVDEEGDAPVREPRGHRARGAVAGIHRSPGRLPRLLVDPGLAGVDDHPGRLGAAPVPVQRAARRRGRGRPRGRGRSTSGEAVLDVRKRVGRCVMTTRATARRHRGRPGCAAHHRSRTGCVSRRRRARRAARDGAHR